MKLINKIKNLCSVSLLMVATSATVLSSCTEKIDDSALYTFTGEMMIDHFENNPEEFSSYLEILSKVHPSKRSASTMRELLGARGNYTCFAPSNEAIQTYLDSLYAIGLLESNELEQISDSVAESIVFNSIIQHGNNAAYAVVDFEQGSDKNSNGSNTLPTTNMNDRYLSIEYSVDSLNNKIIFVNKYSRITEADIEVENGYIHVIDKVLSASNASVAEALIDSEDMSFFGGLLLLTGWADKLQSYKDETWDDFEKADEKEKPKKFMGIWPATRYIGYTIFAETDSVFAQHGITTVEELKEWLKGNAYYNDDTSGHREPSYGDDYEDENNAVNQFVSYHLLPEALRDNTMVTFANEYPNPSSSVKNRGESGTPFSRNVWEYWETMGMYRRSLKITGLKDGVRRINRVSVYNKTTYNEISNQITMPGININTKEGLNTKNGWCYPIDDILVWNIDVPTKVLNERMRYDITSLFPELLTNGFRQNRNGLRDDAEAWFFNLAYLDNLVAMDENTYFQYLPNKNYEGSATTWVDYQIDEFNIQGNYDFTMKLPPVPYTGTYEIRYGINANENRGMAQIYIGTNPNNLPAIGIPLNLNSSGVGTAATGWVADPTSGMNSDEAKENDKSMRNLGFMKGPNYIYTTQPIRQSSNALRKIIYTGQLEAGKTYYIRFKSVLDNSNGEFFYDYLEFVPKSIYGGDEPEDVW